MYFEYTDNSFTERVIKAENLGLLGPVISAEEGDEIIVSFLILIKLIPLLEMLADI